MHFNSWIFFLLMLVVMMFRLLGSAANKASKGSGNTNKRSTSPPAPVESDDARIRKFLEALGQPAGSTPPPPVTQRPIYQKPVVPSELPKRITLPGQISQAPYQKKTFKPKAAEASFEVHQATAKALSAPPPPLKSPAEAYAAATSPTPVPTRSETNIAALLRSPSGLRDAIILREIFGPPRSLQTFDLAGSA
jgi:hypothetical protein